MNRWRWLAQLALAGVLVWFVGRALAGQWQALRQADWSVTLAPGWLTLSVALVLLTFGLQVESWRTILAGWQQHLGRIDAARTWFLANLGRYLPGKVWSVAGMIVLAARQGVATWAATASAVVLQVIGLGAAFALIAATLPAADTGLRVVVGAGVAAGTLAMMAWPPAISALQRLVPKLSELRPLPPAALLLGSGLSAAGWVSYGASFWALSRGLGQPPVLSVWMAIGVFALAYTVGLLALFAPGGAVVREAVLLALLAPVLGPGGALTLALASRLLLTVIELAVAASFFLTQPRSAAGATG